MPDLGFAWAGAPTTIAVLNNDTDPENGALTVTSVTQPSGASVSIIGGGTGVNFNAPFSRMYSFTYTITDPGGLTDTATVDVSVLQDCGGQICL